MIWSLIIFLAGAYCGHVVSPWIDGQMADLFDDDKAIERDRGGQ